MGMGATDLGGRLLTSIYGQDSSGPFFNACYDVPKAGVLLALPALLATGLLSGVARHFRLPKGYYWLEVIFILLAFMALTRTKSMEKLRYSAPGEWGKLLGTDRCPEVKTLRDKTNNLVHTGDPHTWAGELCRDWMALGPDCPGFFYIDGHVRVYHGHQTELPRHYVSRQRLCLRATADYWVNAMDGQPFFVVNTAVDPGLQKVLEHDIVPRLEREVPNQPEQLRLDGGIPRHRFTLVYDREGYSPGFMARMRQKRIACLTYKKHPGDDWPEAEFQLQSVTLSSGNTTELRLAERGVFLGGKLWLREIRKLTATGHQTAIITTDYITERGALSAAMFARWSQENFFAYMRQNYGLDRLIDYSTEEIAATTRVVNPQYREIDGEVRKSLNHLNRKHKEFGALNLDKPIEPAAVVEYELKKAGLQEEIAAMEREVEELKSCRKDTPKHVTIKDLPPEDRFRRLGTRSKYFIDTIKMIAYRAETAMVSIVREKMSRRDDGRSLLQSIYTSDADIIPDEEAQTLTVRLHQPANRSNAETIRHLCDELNATATCYPGTKLGMVYELVS